jgi:hypothetical protein
MIKWQYFPKSKPLPNHLSDVIKVFTSNYLEIESDTFNHKSNDVLNILAKELEQIGFKMELGKKDIDKVVVPVLFGLNGKLEKSFDADGFNETTKTVLEIEAGRAVSNYQFLKDLFQACMMHDVDYLIIAVRKTYGSSKQQDFKIVTTFFETLFVSGRLTLPLTGILIIGY